MNREQRRRAFAQAYADFRVTVPEGGHGLWAVRRQVMTAKDVLVNDVFEKVLKTGRFAREGVYTKLLRYGKNDNPYEYEVVMSDHECEVADHEALVAYAKAHAPLRHVLINGLGLGVALVLLAPYAERFTVVERERSVIRLVQPHYDALLPGRLTVIHADALSWTPPKGERYDAVWHDIWTYISHENLPEMRLLHRKYGRRCDWQASWARAYCERDVAKRRAHPERYEGEVSVDSVLESVNATLAKQPEGETTTVGKIL